MLKPRLKCRPADSGSASPSAAPIAAEGSDAIPRAGSFHPAVNRRFSQRTAKACLRHPHLG